jgi:hypothetical protein
MILVKKIIEIAQMPVRGTLFAINSRCDEFGRGQKLKLLL